MFFTRQCVCFRYKNFTLSSLDSRTWVNFFKESFLVDFNYKVLFCNLIKSFLFSSAFTINHLTFNRWQLTGLYGLFVFFRTVSGAAWSLKGNFLVFFRALLVWLLIVVLVYC